MKSGREAPAAPGRLDRVLPLRVDECLPCRHRGTGGMRSFQGTSPFPAITTPVTTMSWVPTPFIPYRTWFLRTDGAQESRGPKEAFRRP